MSSSLQNTFRCVACTVSDDHMPFFLTFREVCQHSLLVHRVTLETAVQSSTMLPEKLATYQCRLCSSDQKLYLCETLIQTHLETHSVFFFKKWKEFTEVKCRVCEMVIESEGVEEHMDKLHPRDLFADIKDLEENGFCTETKITSPIKQSSSLNSERSSNREEENKLSMENAKSPLDMLLEMGLVEPLEEVSEEATEQIEDTDLIHNNTEPSETIITPSSVKTSTLKTLSDNEDHSEDNNELIEKIVGHPRKVKFMSGYAYFFHHEKSELKRRNPKGKLNTKMVIEKWKNFSQDEKNVYNDMATKYKSSGFKPISVPKVKEKANKPKPKVKKSKSHIEKVKVLTNREFVDKFEDISSRNEIVSEKNRVLLKLICKKKLSILTSSHELQKRKDSEADYKARFQKLSIVHEKCQKGV